MRRTLIAATVFGMVATVMTVMSDRPQAPPVSVAALAAPLPNVRLTYVFFDQGEWDTASHDAYHAKLGLPKPDPTRSYSWSEHGYEARFALQVDPKDAGTKPRYRGQPVKLGAAGSRQWRVVIPAGLATGHVLEPRLEYMKGGLPTSVPPYARCACDNSPNWQLVSQEPTAARVGVEP